MQLGPKLGVNLPELLGIVKDHPNPVKEILIVEELTKVVRKKAQYLSGNALDILGPNWVKIKVRIVEKEEKLHGTVVCGNLITGLLLHNVFPPSTHPCLKNEEGVYDDGNGLWTYSHALGLNYRNHTNLKNIDTVQT